MISRATVVTLQLGDGGSEDEDGTGGIERAKFCRDMEIRCDLPIGFDSATSNSGIYAHVPIYVTILQKSGATHRFR